MSTREISNSDDVIDSRDVIARIEELHDIATDDSDAYTQDERTEANNELAVLQALAEEAEGYAPDWSHGETLIRDSYFTDYAMELLKDCGDLPAEIPHYIVIDEEATARNIRMDYTAVDFDGVTYWIR